MSPFTSEAMRRPVVRYLCGALLLAGLVVGCAESFDATRLGVPVTMGRAVGDTAQGVPFSVKRSSLHAMWGLFTLSQASVEKALAGQLVGGKAVTDVRIKVKSRWTDLLVTALTAGLLIPRTVTIEGTVRDTLPASTP